MTVLNSLDLDEARYFFGPDLVPNCLQMWLINRLQQSCVGGSFLHTQGCTYENTHVRTT